VSSKFEREKIHYPTEIKIPFIIPVSASWSGSPLKSHQLNHTSQSHSSKTRQNSSSTFRVIFC